MAEIYYDKDADPAKLEGKTVSIIGYGSQGHAHALNLHDSGVKVVVGLRDSSPKKGEAQRAGLEVVPPAEAAKRGDIVMILIPDELQPQVYLEDIEPNLEEGNMLMFAHGFSIHFHQIEPPENVDVAMIAPKGPGRMVRREFEDGRGVPDLVAVHQDYTGTALEKALAYGRGIGGGRAGIFRTSFREETETDLFGEQAVLCGGVTSLMRSGFETLVEAGYQPEMAYFECIHEMKLIVDLIYEGGFEYMRSGVSNTAEYGDYITQKKVVDKESKDAMKKVLSDIQEGVFAKNWILENKAGQASFKSMRARHREHQLVEVGERLRGMMPWLEKKI
ncbi:MAG: ketol-acid reductoisomerase [Sediminispirochaetaceae bacterium]